MAFLFLLPNSSGCKDTLDLQCRGLSQPDLWQSEIELPSSLFHIDNLQYQHFSLPSKLSSKWMRSSTCYTTFEPGIEAGYPLTLDNRICRLVVVTPAPHSKSHISQKEWSRLSIRSILIFIWNFFSILSTFSWKVLTLLTRNLSKREWSPSFWMLY